MTWLKKNLLNSYHTAGFESPLELLAAYEFITVIRLDRDYLLNVERLYEFNHHLASNQSIHQDRVIIIYNHLSVEGYDIFE